MKFRRQFQRLSWLGLIVLAGNCVQAEDLTSEQGRLRHAGAMKEGLALFKENVRAILENNCLECHGGEKVEGDFDMSTRESMLGSGVIASTSSESDLMDSITHRFEPYMPHERDKLAEEDIAALAQWIDFGAPFDQPLAGAVDLNKEGPRKVTDEDRDYWAYRSLTKTSVPVLDDDDWARGEIDHFILKELRANGLEANPVVRGRTLMRRAYLNAIGLPPTPDEVNEFVNDIYPKAYERMVDRLLDSPHYGERWARHWMDIARFAESTGFEIDFDRPHAYHYRDFLIKAFNNNMPYDQFVRWQVAGDELNPSEPLALMATGFLGAGTLSSVITEKEFESSRYDELDDIVNTMGTALLGTTVGCARCHDHKYDPIISKDYYELAAHFARTVRTYVDHNPGAQDYESIKASWDNDNETLVRRLSDYESEVLDDAFQDWIRTGPFELPLERWIVLSPESFSSREGSPMEKLCDDSVLVLAQETDRENETSFFEFETSLRNLVGLRMETLTHPSLPKNGPGNDHEGGFTVTEIKVHVRESGSKDSKWKVVELESAKATSQENDLSLSAAASINRVTKGWSIDLDAFGKNQALVIRFSKPVGYEAGTKIKITVSSGLNVNQMVGRPRFSVTQDPKATYEINKGTPVHAYQGLLKLIIGMEPKTISGEEMASLRRWFGRNDPGWLELNEQLVRNQLDRPKSTKIRIMASSDSLPPVWHRSAHKGYPSFYETTHYLERGDLAQKGEVAPPGVPKVLVRKNDAFENRIDSPNPRTALADWLTDVEFGAGALLARVFVNRVWHYQFGQGIVATPSDFGKQGGNPSHPELLDWLACDFVEHGWNVKRLQKQIMTSAVYRQNSEFVESKSAADIENRLLWRYAPRRAEAEVIRDSLLHVSGLLDPTQFGPGTRDPEMVRRSIYFFIKRAALIPEMTLFDWPEHLVGIGQRTSTTIAPQALQFLNGPQSRKYAEGVAGQITDSEDLEALIKQAYSIVLNRFPVSEEMELGIEFIESQKVSYRDRGYDENAAIIDYCQSLLSLNEFLFIR